MSSGTKLTLVVVLLVFVGSGIYFAFIAPPAAGEKSTNQGVAPPKASAPAPSAPVTRRPEQPAAGQRPLATDRSSSPPVATPPASPSDLPTDRRSAPDQALRSPVVSEPRPVEVPRGGQQPPRDDASPTPEPAPSSGSGAKSDEAAGVPARPKVIIVPPADELPKSPGAGSAAPTPDEPRVTEPTGPRPVAPVGAPPTRPSTAGGTSSPASGAGSHTVASGDTMTLLAERYFGDRNKWQLIAKANPLVDPAAMKVGTRLVIPSASATTAAPSTPVRPAAAGSTIAGAAHEVQAGETLYSIARQHYGTPTLWERIYQANRAVIGDDPASLKVGMRLSVPPKPAV